jgi:hypothetical protein
MSMQIQRFLQDSATLVTTFVWFPSIKGAGGWKHFAMEIPLINKFSLYFSFSIGKILAKQKNFNAKHLT